ncbi:hypothetical protein ElyMa_005750700 [Elysia marginata]|uniref:Uncharacterized protein n=1 Tax=Elysia marginata TaxID=1093978 RepID=A0AAV4FNF5_9GAST|nr:hypothetical protein ElyMa_005750700 [Elysia marginata]
MHETKNTTLRALTPISNETEEGVVESNQTQQMQEKGQALSSHLNIPTPSTGIKHLDSAIGSTGADGVSPPRLTETLSLSPEMFFLRTPLKQPPKIAFDDIRQATHTHQGLLVESAAYNKAIPPDKYATVSAESKKRAMSPAERMGYIRTIVDDVEDDFMSSSFNSASRSSSFNSASRSSSFSCSRVSLALARRNFRRNLSGGGGAIGSRGSTRPNDTAAPTFPSGMAGTELMDYLMSVATGDTSEFVLSAC